MLKIFKRVSLILCAVALLTVIAVPAVKSVAYATNNEQAEAVTYAESEVVIPAETETSATENRDNSKGSKAIAAGICVGLAAALGAGLKSNRPVGAMIVDIGGGTTDIAVITMGCISVSRSVKVAGNALDEAIVRQIRRERDVIIGEKTGEFIKKQIGCSYLREVE